MKGASIFLNILAVVAGKYIYMMNIRVVAIFSVENPSAKNAIFFSNPKRNTSFVSIQNAGNGIAIMKLVSYKFVGIALDDFARKSMNIAI